MLLADPAYTVPPVDPPGPFGTLPWLRASVSRFAEGEAHARRRAIVEALLAGLDVEELREAARRAAHSTLAASPPAPAASPPAPALSPPTPALSPPARTLSPPGAAVPLPYLPVAVLAEATGVRDVPAAVAAVRVVAAAYHPGTDAPGADAALGELIALLPAGEPEVVAQHVALLVQACEATAALVRGALERPLADVLRDTPPVPATRRRSPSGEIVLVPLDGHPFGAGPRRCPGQAHALALAEGVVEGAR
jgi:hypothetical protein